MSEEDNHIMDLTGPSDIQQVPYGLLLDDQHRRNVILAPAYEQIIQVDEETGEQRVVGLKTNYPNAASVMAAGLSTQNNLLDLNPYQARAKKLEYDILCLVAGLPHRRNPKIRTALASSQFAFSNTVDGMAEEGTFSLLLTKLTGSIREYITGVRGRKE